MNGLRLRAGLGAHLRAFGRRPLHLLMLVGVPPLVVTAYGAAMETLPALPGLSTPPATAGRVSGAVFAAAFLAGLVGLFQALGAREADDRLALAGFDRAELLGSRLGLVAGVSLAAACSAGAVLLWTADVATPPLVLVGLCLGALTYGLVGLLVGTVLPRELEGSLALVFVADGDSLLASGLVDAGGLARATPLFHPHAVVSGAVEGTGTWGDVAGGAAVLAALGLVTAVVALAGGERP